MYKATNGVTRWEGNLDCENREDLLMIYVDFSYYGDDNSRLASLHKAWPPQNLASKVGYRGEACQPHHLRQILLATVDYQLFVLLRNSAHNVHMICFNTSDTIWASIKPFCVFFFFLKKK